jgi:hypothetical protein
MRAHRVRALLMGGQACVFYGAAEFSRSTDFAIRADAANLALCRRLLSGRRLLAHAAAGKITPLERALLAEETRKRQRDKQYWRPLLKELEKLRHNR